MSEVFCYGVIVMLLLMLLLEVRSDIKEAKESLENEINLLRSRWNIRYSIDVTDPNYKGVLSSTTWYPKRRLDDIPYVPNVGDEVYIVDGNREFHCKVKRVFHNTELCFTLVDTDCYKLVEKEI